jgi:GNAT superfamily N-acetyltransferase
VEIKQVKDIFAVDKSLTKHLWEYWQITQDNWLSPQSYWFVIFDGDEWIAYGAARVHNITSIYLGPTYVKENYRGQGLQVKLIKRRIRLAKRLGHTKVISSTFTNNFASINNLIECRFKMVKTWLSEPEPHTLYWERPVTGPSFFNWEKTV